jgi:hypothetical protein
MANTNWQVVDEDKVTAADQLGSSRAAERACMADRNCLAWNNWYYYISASSSDAVTYYKYDKMCTYARSIGVHPALADVCPAGGWNGGFPCHRVATPTHPQTPSLCMWL